MSSFEIVFCFFSIDMSASVFDDPPTHMSSKELKKFLKDRGLASYGTREAMLQRLLDGRRWFSKQQKYPVMLHPNQAALLKLAFVGVETTPIDKLYYVYEPIVVNNEEDEDDDLEKAFALISVNEL